MFSSKNLYQSIFLFLIFFGIQAHAQSPSLIDFGQNRVQYKEFKWQFYETENFRIYFYQGGQDIGKYVVLNSENLLKELTKSLDFRLQRKLDIIVYNDISDLRQSNIGLDSKDQVENGQVKLLDNKLFVYFNGKHEFLDEQIKEGISKVFVSKYVTGSGLRETFRNSVTASLPPWYTKGMTAYNTYGWNTSFENQLKDGILSGRFKDLTKISQDEMAFIGHSIWNYVEEKYGIDAVSNLMYLVKVNRSIDRGFRYVTNKTLSSFLEEWYFYYLKRYKGEKEIFTSLDLESIVEVPVKKYEKMYSPKLSPKGDKIAYLTNEQGKWKVHIYDIKEKTKKVVFKGGFRTNTIKTDLMNPIIDWDQRGSRLTMIYEFRDKFFLRHYNIAEEELEDETAIRKFQKIFDFSYAEDSKHLIMSAMKKGQIDIFKYYMPSTKVTQITNDFYDDLQPSYAEVGDFKGYLFVSNRPDNKLKKQKLDTILPNGNFDVFFFDKESETQKLIQVTSTPFANESFPQAYDKNHYTFLGDENGINNRYIGNFEKKKVEDKIQYIFNTKEYPNQNDSIILDQNEPIDSAMDFGRELNEVVSKTKIPFYEYAGVAYLNSNYNNGISELNTSSKVNKSLELIFFNQKDRLILSEYDEQAKDSNTNTDYIDKLKKERKKNVELEATKVAEEIAEDTIVKPVIFQSKFDDWVEDNESGYGQMLSAMKSEVESGSGYNFSRTRQYFIKLKADDVNLSLDNKLLITPYQVFNPNTPVFNNNGITGFVKLGVRDLFENHRIHGGFRLSDQSIVPREFYLTYENLTKRLDKEYTYYRNTIRNNIQEYNGNGLIRPEDGLEVQTTNYAHVKLKYALDILNSMRFKVAYRNEKTSYKSTEGLTLNAENIVNNWAIAKFEFVHDHTIKLRPNTLQGLRANGYVEFQKEFPGRNVTVFGDNLNLPTINDGYMLTWGADVRHYQKVYKTITWANRLAYSTSIGTRKVVYYLGGSDGQLLPGFDQTNDVSNDQNYAFQALAQQMRGFPQNTRNGNSYMVLNSELRVPVFSAFSKSTMRSKLLESFEIVAFFDIGSAWEGPSPWSDDNLYTETRENGNGTAIVELSIYKDPIVFAFGPGVRANIFGYFFKFDLGWGYDTGELLAPKMHVSMTYDF